MLFAVAGFIFIVASAILINKLLYRIKNNKHKRMIDLNVKKKLISSDNYGSLSNETLILVKKDIIRTNMLFYLITIPIFVILFIAAIYDKSGLSVILFIIITAIIFGIMFLTKTLYEIGTLSFHDKLIKIKGFIFRQRGNNELSALYYDMIKMKYCIFTQNLFFRHTDNAQLGNFVNLIGVRTDKKVKIIRILTF